jgi:hypothetical protein
MTKNISAWFKIIPEGWKFFGAIVGFTTIISVAAVKIDHWKDKDISQENVIEYLKSSDKAQLLYNEVKDSIDLRKWNDLTTRLKYISDSLRISINNQQTLTNAVGTLGSKVTTTVPELFKLMGGLQFKIVEEVQTKSVFPDTKIRIIKIDTTNKR